MRKFILIDQSIKDAGGHHLEYALRLLKAAKQANYQTVLATNKECETFSDKDIDLVENSFTHTFWENIQSESLAIGKPERKIIKRLIAIKSQMIYELMTSDLGFSFISASNGLSFRDAVTRYGTSSSGKRISKLSLVLGYGINRLNNKYIDLKSKYRGILSKVSRLKRSMFILAGAVVGLVALPFLIPYVVIRWNKLTRGAETNSEQFSSDLKQLLTRIDAKNDDIIFIPTLGNVELTGSAAYIKKNTRQKFSWHFLFRRNLFQGREPTYQSQIDDHVKTIQAFSLCKSTIGEEGIYFYTDTDALTEQYNRLGMYKFKTLPIPLDDTLCKKDDLTKTGKNIVYIGDAREEKGYHLLSRLVGDLRAAGYSKDDITFTFQSNFNVPGGEPGPRIAKAELSVEDPGFVNLVEGPFDSDKYSEIINHADIILIPYNADNYYARSSGVFAEALYAGIPVVTCDKSWMSQELYDLNQNYYRSLLATQRVLQTIEIDATHLQSDQLIKPRSPNKYTWIALKIEQMFENPGQYLDVTWTIEGQTPTGLNKETVRKTFSIDLREIEAYGVIKIPASKKAFLQFKLDFGDRKRSHTHKLASETMSISAFELDLTDEAVQFDVASLYCTEDDFSASVIDAIENCEQYQKRTSQFKDDWKSIHDAGALVRTLAGEVV